MDALLSNLKHLNSSMKSAYNLLWIAPHVERKNTSGTEAPAYALPERNIDNVFRISKRNPHTDVRLWIDSQRLTGAQVDRLEELLNTGPNNNITLHDLRRISAFNGNPLYNKASTHAWGDKHSMLWRQVDAARILICLEGNYDQVFYSDMDVTDIVIESDEIQKRLIDSGMVVSGGIDKSGYAWFENQMFGFSRDLRNFFQLLYIDTLRIIMEGEENGYRAFVDFMNRELSKRSINARSIVYECHHFHRESEPISHRSTHLGSENNNRHFPLSAEDITENIERAPRDYFTWKR